MRLFFSYSLFSQRFLLISAPLFSDEKASVWGSTEASEFAKSIGNENERILIVWLETSASRQGLLLFSLEAGFRVRQLSLSQFPLLFPVFLSLFPPLSLPSPYWHTFNSPEVSLFPLFWGTAHAACAPPFPFPSSSSHFLPPFTWKFSYLLHMTTWEEWEVSAAKSDNPLVFLRGDEKEKVQPELASSNS